jgi:hypothetical protein
MNDRRRIRDGELFNSDDLDAGRIELEKPTPRPEPPEREQTEPWARTEELEHDHPVRDWVRRRLHGDA